MLNLGQVLGRLNHPLQTVIVQFIGGGARGAAAKNRANGGYDVLLRDILMNGVIGKAGESALPAVEEHLNLIGSRILLDAGKDVSRFGFGQHSAWFFSLCVLCGKSVASVSRPNFDIAKSRRARSVSRSHHLLGLTLSTMRDSPQRPLIPRTDGVHRVPELGRNSRIRRILQ